MHSWKRVAGITLLSLSSIQASAKDTPDIKSGLWEHSIEIKSASGRIEAAIEQSRQMMANMPPEQRAIMESMMAEQGINLDLGGRTVKTCMTEEMIANVGLPQTDEDCTQEMTETKKGHFSMTLSCTGAEKMTGTGEFIVADRENFSGKVDMDVTMEGQEDKMTITQQGRWLASDCGDVPSE